MKLCRRIIREIAIMSGVQKATRGALSDRLGISAASVGAGVKMLLDKGLLASVAESAVDGRRAPDSLAFGDGALIVLVECAKDGLTVSLRDLEGNLLQRKFIAEEVSLSAEDRAMAAASAVFSYCGIFAQNRDRIALGVIGADRSDRSVWRCVDVDLVLNGDLLILANKRFGGTDLLVRVVSGEAAEISVMRGGEIINRGVTGRSAAMVGVGSRLVELAVLLDADNIVLLGENDADERCESLALELRRDCLTLGARARILVDSEETRYLLICEMLRDVACERSFK